MNRNIIIVILAIIVVAGLGVIMFSQPSATDGKINTQINFLSENTLKNGQQVQFELKDVQGNIIAGQNLTITYDDGSGNPQTFNVVSDASGKAFLNISSQNAGNYNVTVTYAGNDQYAPCTAMQTITVVEETSDSAASSDTGSSANTATNTSGTSSSSSSNSSSSNLHYDSQYNFYYDDSGIIRGGQNDGYSADYIRSTYDEMNAQGSSDEQ